MCNAHDLSLYHHQVCDCRLTVYSVPICLCTIFHIPVAIHGPQTEYNKTGFFTWLPRFCFTFCKLFISRDVYLPNTAHTISGPYALYGFTVASTSEIHIPNIFSPMDLENTKYGVGVPSNGRRVTECFVDTGHR